MRHLCRIKTRGTLLSAVVKRRPKSERREWEEQVRIGEEEETEAAAALAATRNFWDESCPFARPRGRQRGRRRGRSLENGANDLLSKLRLAAASGRAAKAARSSHVSAGIGGCSRSVGRGLSQFQAYCLLLLLLRRRCRLRNGKTHFQELIRRGRKDGGTDGRQGERADKRQPTRNSRREVNQTTESLRDYPQGSRSTEGRKEGALEYVLNLRR